MMGPDAMYSECDRLGALASDIPDGNSHVRDQIMDHIGTVEIQLQMTGHPTWFQEGLLIILADAINEAIHGEHEGN